MRGFPLSQGYSPTQFLRPWAPFRSVNSPTARVQPGSSWLPPLGKSSQSKSRFSGWGRGRSPSYPHKTKSKEGGGVGEGGGGRRARSLLVNQSWFPRWSCSRFDFSSHPSPSAASPHPQLHGFNSSLKSSGASFQISPAPPTPNNSVSYRKEKGEGVRWPSLEERERNSGRNQGEKDQVERE